MSRIVRSLAALAMLSLVTSSAAEAHHHFGGMHFRGRVVAANATFVDLDMSGQRVVVPAGFAPSFLVAGAAVPFGSVTVGMNVVMGLPAFDGEIVAVSPGWVTLAEPNGMLVTVPASYLPSGLTAYQVQLYTPSGSLVMDPLGTALTLTGQGYSLVLADQSYAAYPDYMDYGPFTCSGVVQQITPTYVVILSNGVPSTFPIYGNSFVLNGAVVPVGSLAVGRNCTVRAPIMVGTVASFQSNALTLQTFNHQRVTLPMAALPTTVRNRAHVFARLPNGRVVNAPLASAATLQHAQHASILTPRSVSLSTPAPAPMNHARPQAAPQLHNNTPSQPAPHTAPAPQLHANPMPHSAPVPQLHNNIPSHPMQHSAPAPQLHNNMPSHPTQHSAPAPQLHDNMPSHPTQHSAPAPQLHNNMPQHSAPAPQLHGNAPPQPMPHSAPAPQLHNNMPQPRTVQHTAPPPQLHNNAPAPAPPHPVAPPPVRNNPPPAAPEHQPGPQHSGPAETPGPH